MMAVCLITYLLIFEKYLIFKDHQLCLINKFISISQKFELLF